jgi:hypothetical protein
MANRPTHKRPRIHKGLWFPLSLAALLLVALPGAVLLALSLLGYEGPANAWLQRNVSLSYHNSLPAWAAILLFLVPMLIALLYFLKLRRKPMQVPSTFLWRKSIEDLHVNSLFQWLRDNVLLLVQLCVVLLLIYSSLAFQVHGAATTAGKHYILLIDSSASMSVTDVAPSRLEVARKEALHEIDSHAEGDTGMVIEFNSRATILQPYTSDKGLLRAAVRRIQQTQRPTRIDEALALADSLANPSRSTDDAAVRPAGEDPAKARTYVSPDGIAAEVHLFSDGRFPDVPGFAAGNLSLEFHRIGVPGPESVNNIGIVSLNAVRDEKDASRLQVFVRLLNFRKEPAEVTVALEWGQAGREDLSRAEKPLPLPARVVETGDKGEAVRDRPGEGALTFELNDVDESADFVIHARIENHRDQFPLDDEAWLVAGVVRKARVLIVTPGNDVLRDFFDLEDTQKVAKVEYLTPADLDDRAKYGARARAGEFDLVVFDRCGPANEEALPLANTFFIDSVPPPWKRKDMPPLKDAMIRNPASSHPLMRHLAALDEIAFTGAFRFDLRDPRVPPLTPRLLEADRETALLFVLPRRLFRDLVLAFPLVNDKGEWTTTWNLKLSFPVFLRNVLYTLGNISDAAAEENVQPGEARLLHPDGAFDQIEVSDPGKHQFRVKQSTGMVFSFQSTDKVGVYQATWPGGGRTFAVNLLDADESNTQPRNEIKLGSQRIEAGHARRQTYDTWKWVALAALVLLVLEWAVYHRRIWF